MHHQKQGYVIGNPVTDSAHDKDSRIPFAHGAALISDELFEVQLHKLGYFFVSCYHNKVVDKPVQISDFVVDEEKL